MDDSIGTSFVDYKDWDVLNHYICDAHILLNIFLISRKKKIKRCN